MPVGARLGGATIFGNMPVLLSHVDIPVSHGHLEGLLQSADGDDSLSVIVCHPHPLHGGTMHNKVVFHAAKALGSLGWRVLRFNFRGAGASTGTYGGGSGEEEDVVAALDYLGSPRVLLAGFSFGSAVGLSVGVRDSRVVALCGIGLPVNSGWPSLPSIQGSPKPKLIIQGEQDEYGPRAALEGWFEAALPPKELCLIPGADHFLTSHDEELRQAIVSTFRGHPDWTGNASQQA